MDVDFERIAGLLSVVEQAAGHSGKLNAISNAAMSELLEINSQLREEAIAAESKRRAADIAKQPQLEQEAEPARQPNYPGDSQTATIADRRI